MADGVCGGLARQRKQKHNNGGFRHFATWTLSLTCPSADIGVWLEGSETKEGDREFATIGLLGVMFQ